MSSNNTNIHQSDVNNYRAETINLMELIYRLGAFCLVLVFLSMFVGPASAAGWPTDEQWNPILNQSYANMTDLIDDAGMGGGNNELEVVGNDTYPAVYIFNNGTHLFFRMRVGADPQAGKIYLSGGRWVIIIDTDGILDDYEYGIIVQAESKIDTVSIVQNTEKLGLGDPSDKWETTLVSYTDQSNVLPAPSNLLGSPDYFIDWFVPYSDFLNHTNTTDQSILRFILGTGL